MLTGDGRHERAAEQTGGSARRDGGLTVPVSTIYPGMRTIIDEIPCTKVE